MENEERKGKYSISFPHSEKEKLLHSLLKVYGECVFELIVTCVDIHGLSSLLHPLASFDDKFASSKAFYSKILSNVMCRTHYETQLSHDVPFSHVL